MLLKLLQRRHSNLTTFSLGNNNNKSNYLKIQIEVECNIAELYITPHFGMLTEVNNRISISLMKLMQRDCVTHAAQVPALYLTFIPTQCKLFSLLHGLTSHVSGHSPFKQ